MPNRGRLLCVNEVDAVNVGEGSIRAERLADLRRRKRRQIRVLGKQTVAVDANGQKRMVTKGCFGDR
jgi:hypothetical protein